MASQEMDTEEQPVAATLLAEPFRLADVIVDEPMLNGRDLPVLP